MDPSGSFVAMSLRSKMKRSGMKVEIVKYDESWKQMFEEEAQKVKEIFGHELIDIHHIGSTSVQGLKAKPIIDMMPVVKHIENVDSFNQQMTEIGYEPLGEFGMKGRRYFRKGAETRTNQVHVFQSDNQNDIQRHLAIRNYLREFPQGAIRYGDLKEKLAKEYPNNIAAYMDGKDAFVKELEKAALDWYRSRSR